MISGGRLRFKATVRRESSSDNLGKRNKTYGLIVGTFRCDLRDIGASEGDISLGVAAIKSYEIHARWQSLQRIGLLETDRLIIDGMTFNINGIRNETNRDRLGIIDVTEVR